jgi:hypothetical protein
MLAALTLVAAIVGSSAAFAQKPVEQPANSLAANQIAFMVRSAYPNVVDIAFYADGRRAAWPGGRRVWNLTDSKVHRYVLNCIRGEKICYGAGVRNVYSKYWGVGIGNKHRCATCCYRCEGQETKVIVLNP